MINFSRLYARLRITVSLCRHGLDGDRTSEVVLPAAVVRRPEGPQVGEGLGTPTLAAEVGSGHQEVRRRRSGKRKRMTFIFCA